MNTTSGETPRLDDGVLVAIFQETDVGLSSDVRLSTRNKLRGFLGDQHLQCFRT